MGGPSATVFFEHVIEASTVECFLREQRLEIATLCGDSSTPVNVSSKPHKKKVRATWSYDLSVAPTELGVSPPQNWREDSLFRDRELFMYLSARTRFGEWFEFLLERDTLPEEISQVVDVGCYTKGFVEYDAVNALAAKIAANLGGNLRTPAQK